MLKLDGKPFTKTVVPPAVEKIREFLQKAPADEIYSRNEMTVKGFSMDTVNRFTANFPEYSKLWKNKRYYGSLKAIVAFEKEVNQ